MGYDAFVFDDTPLGWVLARRLQRPSDGTGQHAFFGSAAIFMGNATAVVGARNSLEFSNTIDEGRVFAFDVEITDCNVNSMPDECERAAILDVIFVLDESGSVVDGNPPTFDLQKDAVKAAICGLGALDPIVVPNGQVRVAVVTSRARRRVRDRPSARGVAGGRFSPPAHACSERDGVHGAVPGSVVGRLTRPCVRGRAIARSRSFKDLGRPQASVVTRLSVRVRERMGG